MTGLNMQEFKTALKGSHEIEFIYNGKDFVIQPELRGVSVYLVIWQSGDNAACIAETKIDDKGQLIKPVVKEGDKVLFTKWSGTEVKMSGETLVVMKECDIIAIIED